MIDMLSGILAFYPGPIFQVVFPSARIEGAKAKQNWESRLLDARQKYSMAVSQSEALKKVGYSHYFIKSECSVRG